MRTRTIKVTFAKDFAPGLDTLYTYKTADEVKPDQLVYVMTSEGEKRVRVIHIDAVYDKKAEESYGPLAEAFAKSQDK